MSDTIFEVAENTNRPEPLADISVPAGQQVTLGPSSTPDAFRIQGTQLFLNVTPDYEVQMAGRAGYPRGGGGRAHPPQDPSRHPQPNPRHGVPDGPRFLRFLRPPGNDWPFLGPQGG